MNGTTKPNIIIIDDDEGICETLSDIFEEEGYEVLSVKNGRDALDEVKQIDFNVAIIDIELPDLDGITLLREFKEIHPEMVCIIITGHASLQNAIKALEEGADSYFVKTFVMEEVLHRVEEALEKQRLWRELRESEEKHRSLYESSKDGIASIDIQGNLLDANQAFLDMLGYTLDELKKLTFQQITPNRWHKMDEEIIENQIMVKGYSDEYEKEYIKKDGTIFPVSLRAWLVKDEQGTPVGIWGIVRDITERKQVEAERAKAQNYLFSSLASIPDGVLLLDKQSRFTFVNPIFLKWLDREAEEFIGKSVQEISPPIMTPETTRIIAERAKRRTQTGEVIVGAEVEIINKDNKLMPVSYSASGIKDEQGNVLGEVVFIKDMTERQQAEQKIKSLKEKYESLIKNVPDAIYSALPDETGTTTFMSDKWKEWSGYAPEDFYENPEIWPKSIHPEDRDKAVEAYIKAYKMEKEYDFEYRVVHRETGRVRYLRDHGVPIRDETGNIVRVDGIVSDVTERALAEQKIIHLNRVLRAIRYVNQLIVRVKDRNELILKACENLIGTRGYYSSYILLLDEEGNVLTSAEAGHGEKFEEFIDDWKQGMVPECARVALENEEVMTIRNPTTACRGSCPLLKSNMEYAVILAPIAHGNKRFGILSVCLPLEWAEDEKELELFDEVASDIALGLHGIELEEERKLTNQNLRESEEKFRTIAEQSFLGILIIQDDIIKYLNETLASIFEFSHHEMTEMPIEDFLNLIHSEDRPIAMENIKNLQKGHVDFLHYYIYRTYTKTGKMRWVDLYSKTISYQGEVAILATIVDVTEKRDAEQKYRDAEEKERIKAIIEAIPDGILVLNSNGSLSLANRAFKELYQRISQRDLGADFNLHDQKAHSLYGVISELVKSVDSEPVTVEPIKGLHLQLHTKNVRIPGEEISNIMIEFRDVTSFVEFDTLQKQFVSTVSHELRTPISVIVQSLDNLTAYKDRMSSELQDELTSVMALNADILVKIIEDLLVISSIDEKRIKFEWKEFLPSEVLRQVVTQLEPISKKKELAITVNVDDDVQLFGDSDKIAQILRIILDNAIKYSPLKSKIIVRAVDNYTGDYNPSKTEGMLLQVVDEGQGIREEELLFIFQRFYRCKDVGEIPGSGLGLPIAQELIHLHHGEIFVESKFGEGSTFSIFLPKLEKVPK